MQGKSILFSEMTPDPSWEAEFNTWYDTEHIPLRMAVPGFASAQRYRSLKDSSYLAVYETDSLDAFKSEAYGKVKNQPSALTKKMLDGVSGFTRYLGEQISEQRAAHAGADALDAPCLYAVFFNVPAERHQDFNEWYEQDHVPILLQCKDWLMCRRFKIADGAPGTYSHLALHYLKDPVALDSPERARARATPWRARLAGEPWFNGHYLTFTRHMPRQAGRAAVPTPASQSAQ